MIPSNTHGGSRKGAGRPKKAPGERKVTLILYVPADKVQAVRDAAAAVCAPVNKNSQA